MKGKLYKLVKMKTFLSVKDAVERMRRRANPAGSNREPPGRGSGSHEELTKPNDPAGKRARDTSGRVTEETDGRCARGEVSRVTSHAGGPWRSDAPSPTAPPPELLDGKTATAQTPRGRGAPGRSRPARGVRGAAPDRKHAAGSGRGGLARAARRSDSARGRPSRRRGRPSHTRPWARTVSRRSDTGNGPGALPGPNG